MEDAKKKILVVEDDASIRDLYGDILSQNGFDVVSAADGVEGLSKAREGGYSLILLDLMMPKLDGMGVLTGLHDNPPLQNNGPIIVLTNISQDDVVKKAMDLGARGYIVKSNVDPGQFVDEIKGYLSV